MSEPQDRPGLPHDGGPATVPFAELVASELRASAQTSGPAPEPSATPPAAPRFAPRTYSLEFSASGSEYFRIWIVNLLLTLVTLGLYFPWAKVRKLRYFYGNTRLAGHAFDFHGDPKRMLRGYLLVGALFMLYSFAGQVSPVAGLIALGILAAIWPALLRTSMRFRLAQTSWRGLRFQFTGSLVDAYKALLPGFFAAIVLVAVSAVVMPEPPAEGVPPVEPSSMGLVALFAAVGLMYAMLPLMFWLLKRYQHNHYQFASVRTRFVGGPGAFYGLAFKTFGLMLLVGAVAGVLAAVLLPAGLMRAKSDPGAMGTLIMAGVVAVFVLYGVLLFVLQPYVTSRMQNMVWSNTDSRALGFRSDLRFWPLARLMLLNWVLIVLTLGLYWPFAAVATARLRLQALSVDVRTDLDTLVSRGGMASQDASGDAAADLFGLDIGM